MDMIMGWADLRARLEQGQEGGWDLGCPYSSFFHFVGVGAPTVCRPCVGCLEEEGEPSLKELLVSS